MTQELDTSADFQESLDWIIQNCGFPTFQEFAKNPELLRGRKDEFFESIDKNFNPFGVVKHEYYWRGVYKADSLEQVQRMAEQDGYAGDQLEMQPIADRRLDDPNNYDKKITVRVNIYPKNEAKELGVVVANG